MKIIAFGHRQGVGKDTAAEYLTEVMSPKSRVGSVGFADKVKDVAHQIFGWAGLRPGSFYDVEKNRYLREVRLPYLNKTPRELWIGVGNGVRQGVDYEEVWLDFVFSSIGSLDVLIITDLRFPKEADGIKRAGGFIFRIDCPWAPVVSDGADNCLAEYTGWTGILQNDEKGNLQKLYTQIDSIIETYLSKK